MIKFKKFKRINHLAMVTGDLDKTIRFRRNLLGMRLVAGFVCPGDGSELFTGRKKLNRRVI